MKPTRTQISYGTWLATQPFQTKLSYFFIWTVSVLHKRQTHTFAPLNILRLIYVNHEQNINFSQSASGYWLMPFFPQLGACFWYQMVAFHPSIRSPSMQQLVIVTLSMHEAHAEQQWRISRVFCFRFSVCRCFILAKAWTSHIGLIAFSFFY